MNQVRDETKYPLAITKISISYRTAGTGSAWMKGRLRSFNIFQLRAILPDPAGCRIVLNRKGKSYTITALDKPEEILDKVRMADERLAELEEQIPRLRKIIAEVGDGKDEGRTDS